MNEYMKKQGTCNICSILNEPSELRASEMARQPQNCRVSATRMYHNFVRHEDLAYYKTEAITMHGLADQLARWFFVTLYPFAANFDI